MTKCVNVLTKHVKALNRVYVSVLQTHRPAFFPADIGGIEVLDGQTLLLHVEAPQPLTELLPTSTL